MSEDPNPPQRPDKYRIQNFRALGDVTLELSDLTVLIGANGSGKTSALDAIALVGSGCGSENVVGHPEDYPQPSPDADRPAGSESSTHPVLTFWGAGRQLSMRLDGGAAVTHWKKTAPPDAKTFMSTPRMEFFSSTPLHVNNREIPVGLSGFRKGVSAKDVNWKLYPRRDGGGIQQFLFGSRLGNDLDERYLPLREEFRRLFPEYTDIDVETGEFKLATPKAARIPASHVSDGTLFVLALLCLKYKPVKPAVYLIDEPERFLHPQLFAKVIGMLRDFARESNVRIVMTTHSPYMLSEFEPKEVYLFRKEAATGVASATRLSDIPEVVNAWDEGKGFTLGELWWTLTDEGLFAKRNPPAGVA